MMSQVTEHYTPGHGEQAVAFMAERTAEQCAAFFLPHVLPRMEVLDVGCGPGTISAGLALQSLPGSLTAVDAEPSQVALAQSYFARRNITNAVAQIASVYALPFADNAFDAVFSHALFEHLADPAAALCEMRRVLRPGGVLGLRLPDWDGFLLAPFDAEVARAITLYRHIQDNNGGATGRGKALHVLVRAAGFAYVRTSASYATYPDTFYVADYLARCLEEADGAKVGASADDLHKAAVALRVWARRDDAVFHQAWCEVVAK